MSQFNVEIKGLLMNYLVFIIRLQLAFRRGFSVDKCVIFDLN